MWKAPQKMWQECSHMRFTYGYNIWSEVGISCSACDTDGPIVTSPKITIWISHTILPINKTSWIKS